MSSRPPSRSRGPTRRGNKISSCEYFLLSFYLSFLGFVSKSFIAGFRHFLWARVAVVGPFSFIGSDAKGTLIGFIEEKNFPRRVACCF